MTGMVEERDTGAGWTARHTFLLIVAVVAPAAGWLLELGHAPAVLGLSAAVALANEHRRLPRWLLGVLLAANCPFWFLMLAGAIAAGAWGWAALMVLLTVAAAWFFRACILVDPRPFGLRRLRER